MVFVTDRPEPGRSCFQVLAERQPSAEEPLATIDLHESAALGIDSATIDEYEILVRQVFAVLGDPAHTRRDQRKPGAKVVAINPAAPARRACRDARVEI